MRITTSSGGGSGWLAGSSRASPFSAVPKRRARSRLWRQMDQSQRVTGGKSGDFQAVRQTKYL